MSSTSISRPSRVLEIAARMRRVVSAGRPEQIVRWAQAKLISSETFSSTMQEDIYFWRYSLFDNKLKVLS